MTRASESNHWYTKDGQPMYTVIGANGKERNTDLRDAKKHGYIPSVTTILNILAKPGLNLWLQKQAIMAALTLPRQDGENEENWLDRVLIDSKAQGRDAADRGTSMHSEIQSHLEHKAKEYPRYVFASKECLDAHFGQQDWICEESFGHELGFGGKVDLHCPGIIVDIKTKEKVGDKVDVYDEHLLQLAAYRTGLGYPTARCANLFVDLEGNTKMIEHDETKLANAAERFYHLLRFYQIKNGI